MMGLLIATSVIVVRAGVARKKMPTKIAGIGGNCYG